MGVAFLAANRHRAKDLGGRDLSLPETRALRVVLAKMGRATEEQLISMDADIRRMEKTKLLEDLAELHELNEPTVTKLQLRPNARLTYDARLHLNAWLDRVEILQREHPQHLHVAQLLRTSDAQDPLVRDCNLAYLHISAIASVEAHTRSGHLDTENRLPTKSLTDLVEKLPTLEPLHGFVSPDETVGPARMLVSLPEDRIQRARVLHVYADYLHLAATALAYGEPGLLRLPVLGGLLILRGFQSLQREALPTPDYPSETLEALGAQLAAHLEPGDAL